MKTWYLIEMKLLALKVLWDLDKTSQKNAFWTPTPFAYHAENYLQCQWRLNRNTCGMQTCFSYANSHVLRVKKSLSGLKSGWRRKTLNAIEIDTKYSHPGSLVNTSISSAEKGIYQLKRRWVARDDQGNGNIKLGRFIT